MNRPWCTELQDQSFEPEDDRLQLILVVRSLAAVLPSSDLNVAVDFGVDFSSCFIFQGKAHSYSKEKAPENPSEIPRQTSQKIGWQRSPRISAEAVPENAKGGCKTYFSPSGGCKSYCKFLPRIPESPRRGLSSRVLYLENFQGATGRGKRDRILRGL